MRFSTSLSLTTTVLLLALIPSSLASYDAALPKLRRERHVIEKRTLFGSLGSLFSKRDDCGTQFGPTYVDCGPRGCYQPSMGEICCGSESDYCLVGQFCVGLSCCPNGLSPSCCGTGFNCPANVSDYYTTTSTTPLSGTTSTSLPVAVSTTAHVTTSSAKPATSAAAVSSTASTPATPKSTISTAVGITTSKTGTSTPVSSTNTGGVATTVVPVSGAQDTRLRVGVGGVAVVVLAIVGFVAGLL